MMFLQLDRLVVLALRSWRIAWLVCLGTSAAAAQEVQYVFQISVDGLRADQLQFLMQNDPEHFTNFQRFVSEGATTFNARNDYFNPWTLPNHTSMMTGRPVLQPADDPTVHHGYLNNGTPDPADTLHNSGNDAVDYIASTFDQAHDHGLSTALYTGKSKFIIYPQSYNVTAETDGGRADTYLQNGDQGVDKLDRYFFNVVAGTSTNLVAQLRSDFEQSPYDYTFLHLLEPDWAGHSKGWAGPEWDDAVRLVDQHLGQMFELIETSPLLAGKTAMVLTSDHGGVGFNHGKYEEPAVFRVPFMVWGPNVPSSADLYDLNLMTRLDPGEQRPTYTESMQPIRNGDSGNLALSLLGLPPIDGSSINQRQDLIVGPSQTVTWDGADALRGMPGDGQTWQDPWNWTRGESVDRLPVGGDTVSLPVNSQPTTLNLLGSHALNALQVDGDYALVGGDVQLFSGEVTVADERTLSIVGQLSSPAGVIKQGAGDLDVESIDSPLMILEGTVQGPVVVTGDVTNAGRLMGDGGLVAMHVQGQYVQSVGGILQLTIGPSDAGDQLIVDGQVTYGGTLAVDSGSEDLDAVAPGQFRSWTLATASSHAGTFASIQYDGQTLDFDSSSPDAAATHVADGLFRRLEYKSQSLNWIHYQALPGDADGNGEFTSEDLISVLATGGYENGIPNDADWTEGDWNGDADFTTVDLIDALATARYEQPSLLPSRPAQAVPEPIANGLWLLLISGLRRRKDQRIDDREDA